MTTNPVNDPNLSQLSWDLLARVVRGAPWTSVAILLLMIAALGVVCGMPIDTVRYVLIRSWLVLLLFWIVLWSYYHQEYLMRLFQWAFSKKSEDSPKYYSHWWWIAIAMVAVTAQEQRRKEEDKQQAVAAQAKQRNIGEINHAYWNLAIENMHYLRFSNDFNHQRKTRQDWEKIMEVFRAKVKEIRWRQTNQVDPELVAFAQQQVVLDEKLLNLCDEIKQFTTNQDGDQSQTQTLPTLEESLTLISQFTDEQFAKLPPDLQRMYLELIELLEGQSVRLTQIEVMQAKLNERYKPLIFRLPDLNQSQTAK